MLRRVNSGASRLECQDKVFHALDYTTGRNQSTSTCIQLKGVVVWGEGGGGEGGYERPPWGVSCWDGGRGEQPSKMQWLTAVYCLSQHQLQMHTAEQTGGARG